MEEKGEFKIVESQAVIKRLAAIAKRAARLGLKEALLESIDAIYARLRYHPREFGEPKYRLRHARLEVRSGAAGVLAVLYSVHEELPFVFLKEFILLR